MNTKLLETCHNNLDHGLPLRMLLITWVWNYENMTKSFYSCGMQSKKLEMKEEIIYY